VLKALGLEGPAGDAAAPLARQIAQGGRAATPRSQLSTNSGSNKVSCFITHHTRILLHVHMGEAPLERNEFTPNLLGVAAL